MADVRTGSGLEFSVLIDRGLDIGPASFSNAPLAWRSPAAFAHPAYYEPAGLGWLRGFGGGLLTTCGLTTYGAPCTDEANRWGCTAGPPTCRHQPGLRRRMAWRRLRAVGQRPDGEARLFGENLVLRRRITTWLGASRLLIEDAVTNDGTETTPHMLLYHCNLGFPVLSEHSELLIDSTAIPRDAGSRRAWPIIAARSPDAGLCGAGFPAPRGDRCPGCARVALVNRTFEDGRGSGSACAGARPSCRGWCSGRCSARALTSQGWSLPPTGPSAATKNAPVGRLRFLEPGETRHYRLEIGVLASQAEIDTFEVA